MSSCSASATHVSFSLARNSITYSSAFAVSLSLMSSPSASLPDVLFLGDLGNRLLVQVAWTRSRSSWSLSAPLPAQCVTTSVAVTGHPQPLRGYGHRCAVGVNRDQPVSHYGQDDRAPALLLCCGCLSVCTVFRCTHLVQMTVSIDTLPRPIRRVAGSVDATLMSASSVGFCKASLRSSALVN